MGNISCVLVFETFYLFFLQIVRGLRITNGIIRKHKSKKSRRHNGQKKKDKRSINDLQNIHIKLKIE